MNTKVVTSRNPKMASRAFGSRFLPQPFPKERIMCSQDNARGMFSAAGSRPARVWRTFAVALAIAALACAAHAQTFQVVHYFTGGADGSYPSGVLSIDRGGHVFGNAQGGGVNGNGTVFELTHPRSGWIFNLLYQFTGGADGGSPSPGVVIGPDGALYGTTFFGGANGAGTAYVLRPPVVVCRTTSCRWSETTIHTFGASGDGANPGYGALLFDSAGNIYGTTQGGGTTGSGTVYKLTKSGNAWNENILYSLQGPPNDGFQPDGGVIFDSAGNIYSTTATGGANGDGTAFEISPSNGSWSETGLYSFGNNNVGHYLYCTLVMDHAGNLYGTDWISGSVFEITRSNGQWTATAIYTAPHFGSLAALTMDQAGNFYGVSAVGSNGGNDSGGGFVFKLTNSNGQWTLTDLHDFNGSDGSGPISPVAIDASGNLWGTAEFGGQGNCNNSCGVVWEITAQ